MASASAQISDRRQVTVSLDDEHAEQLRKVADAIAEGNKSRAFTLLLDKYAGLIVERYYQEQEQEDDPPVYVRWKVGRLNAEVGAFVAGLVRAGNVPEVACDIAGVSVKQRLAWMKRGRADVAKGKQSVYADFVMALTRAEAECEADDIARLRKHGEKNWTAIAWRLERQKPDRYAQRKRVDGKITHSMVPVIDYDQLTAAETRTLVELLRKASPDQGDPGVSRSARPALELVPGEVLESMEGEGYTELVDEA